MPEPAKRLVCFKVYHQGFGADVGDQRIVDAAWAERAIAAGIVEYVQALPGDPPAEAKP